MTDTTARLVEAEAARTAWDRFIGPALQRLHDEYIADLAKNAVQPLEKERLLAAVQNISMSLRVLKKVESHMMSLIVSAGPLEKEQRRASEIANMSSEERKWASY